MIGLSSACFAIGLIWVCRKGRCECRMIRRASWIRYGNLIISVQTCEKDGEANVGADYFIWEPLSPYCIHYLQSTVMHQCEHYLQSYFLVPIYMRCPSTLFHLSRLFLVMKGKANVHVDDEWTMSAYVGIKTGSNMNSTTVQHKLYASSQRLYARGTNQNETLLCWILWMSASTYSSTNLFRAPSVRTVEDDTLTHGCDG